MTQELQTQYEVIDGYLVDDAGEIVGVEKPDFHVENSATAEWVLSKMLEADSTISGLNAKQEAILANISTERKRQLARRQWLEARFGGELASFAATQLRGKSRTWTCPYGKVSWRRVPRSVEVVDEDAAIRWVREQGMWQAVKVTQKLLISECKEELLKLDAAAGFEFRPEHDRLTIKTGVES